MAFSFPIPSHSRKFQSHSHYHSYVSQTLFPFSVIFQYRHSHSLPFPIPLAFHSNYGRITISTMKRDIGRKSQFYTPIRYGKTRTLCIPTMRYINRHYLSIQRIRGFSTTISYINRHHLSLSIYTDGEKKLKIHLFVSTEYTK